jgi:DNA-binding NtrC family response regulator
MTVFFVDDDIDDREFFIDALSYVDSSIKCVLAKDCDDALRLLDSTDEKPEYLFLDINMPSLDGKGCLGKIKNQPRFGDVRVVMYSNSSDQKLMEEYKKLGATYFLVKPPTFTGLCDSLSVLFGK